MRSSGNRLAQLWPRGLMLTFLFGFLLTACSEQDENVAQKIVRVGVLPDQSIETLHEIYDPLLAHLSEHGGQKFELVMPRDYAHMVALFEDGQIDLGFFGGVTFLQAEDKANAVPLVMRNVDREFTSVFIARADSAGSQLADFKGKRLAFGSNLSTSGHLMPRYYLYAEGLGVENSFSEVVYTGSHDATAFRVRDGEADIGALNASIFDLLVKNGQLDPDEISIIWRTPPYADYVWAANPDLGEAVINTIRDAFLDLASDDPEHEEILTRLGADYFLPATASDFNSLRVVAAGLDIVGVSSEIGLLEAGGRAPT